MPACSLGELAAPTCRQRAAAGVGGRARSELLPAGPLRCGEELGWSHTTTHVPQEPPRTHRSHRSPSSLVPPPESGFSSRSAARRQASTSSGSRHPAGPGRVGLQHTGVEVREVRPHQGGRGQCRHLPGGQHHWRLDERPWPPTGSGTARSRLGCAYGLYAWRWRGAIGMNVQYDTAVLVEHDRRAIGRLRAVA